MPKKKSEQDQPVPAGEAPIDRPVKAAKKAGKKAVERAVEKAIEVENSVEEAVRRSVRKPAAKKAAPKKASVAEAVETGASDADAVDTTASLVDDIQSSELSSNAVVNDSLMVDVVFSLQVHDDVRDIVLVGDFNGWSQASHPLTRNGDTFEVTVALQRDHRYRYRYLVDGHHWENDWNADEYVPNDYGGDDSVRIV